MFGSAKISGNGYLTGFQPGAYSQSAQRPQNAQQGQNVQQGQNKKKSSLWGRVTFVVSTVVGGVVSYIAYSALKSHPVINDTMEKCGFTAEKIAECGCNVAASCVAIANCMAKCPNA